MPLIYERVQNVHEYRLKSKRAGTRKGADRPTVFLENRQPTSDYIIIPKVSSERRQYIPMGFLDSKFIAVNTALIIPNAGLYEFGVLTSSIHMAWMRAVGGRLEMRYQYSKDIVYNNFIWCKPNENQRKKIEETAQKILDVRGKYPDASFADLYDEISMPPDLRDAHKKNDRAVAAAYGWEKILDDEAAIVAELFKLYSRSLDC